MSGNLCRQLLLLLLLAFFFGRPLILFGAIFLAMGCAGPKGQRECSAASEGGAEH
jgi:hypothetical protein